MANQDRKTELRAFAKAAAAKLCADLDVMTLTDVELPCVELDEANGSNSIDTAYLNRLSRGEHLTDNFLANI